MIRSCILIPALLICGCASPDANRAEGIETVRTVEVLVPVPVPCSESIVRATNILEGVTSDLSVEDKVEALAKSDALLRSYISSLEAVAINCGVTIR